MSDGDYIQAYTGTGRSEPAITLVLGHLRVPKRFLFLEIYDQMGK
jgi:hypothetical protein